MNILPIWTRLESAHSKCSQWLYRWGFSFKLSQLVFLLGPQPRRNLENAPKASVTVSQRSEQENQNVPSSAPPGGPGHQPVIEKTGQWTPQIQIPSQHLLSHINFPFLWVYLLPFSSLHNHFLLEVLTLPFTAHLLKFLFPSSDLYHWMK